MLRDTLDDRYEMTGPLGAGGMADVFLARDRLLARDLALKILRGHHAEAGDFVERFRKEARSVAALNHPNVVQIYDQGRFGDGRRFIAMEYVQGGTLRDRIDREGALDPAEAARLASQVASALQAAHGRGIVHRDVKPQNILLDEDGNAKVADFGIAEVAEATARATSASGPDAVFGTAAYMSPEQARGEAAGPQSDLYSLGIVLYEMLTGGVPFGPEGGPLAVAMKHVTASPRPPKERNPHVPAGMDALVMGLLAKDPGDRYGSADEFLEDLGRVREGSPPLSAETARAADTTAVANPRPRPRRRESRSRKLWVAGLVAAMALLALLGGLGLDPPLIAVGVSSFRAPAGGTVEAPEPPAGSLTAAGGGTSDGAAAAGSGPDRAARQAPAEDDAEETGADPPPTGGAGGRGSGSSQTGPAVAPAAPIASASAAPSSAPSAAQTEAPAPASPSPGISLAPGGGDGAVGEPDDGGAAGEDQYR